MDRKRLKYDDKVGSMNREVLAVFLGASVFRDEVKKTGGIFCRPTSGGRIEGDLLALCLRLLLRKLLHMLLPALLPLLH